MGVRIAGVGKSLPARVLTNADLEKMVETSDQWITDRTGIKERRIATEDESSASLGTGAALMALETAGVDASSVDLVICATSTPDGPFPATASVIQNAIGARNAGAFDVNSACAGFLPAFATGAQFINAGVYSRVLVVGSEVMSRIVDWKDRSTCILFGDGAGAVLLEAHERGGPASVVLKSDGSLAKILYARGLCAPPSSITEVEGYFIVMDGREVFRIAVRAMEDVTRQAIAGAGLSVDEVDYVIPHQANARIISAFAKGLGLPAEKIIMNLDKYGNTSSASIPVALCEAWEEGRLQPGDNIVFVAIGGGLAWGATVVEWVGLGPIVAKSEESLKPVGMVNQS